MTAPTRSLNRIGLLIDGRPYTAEPANPDTKLFDIAGREAITGSGPNTLISLVTEAVDTERADIASAQRRVRAAAAAPWTPRGQRPSARQKAIRLAAKQYHAATWQAGYSQAESDATRRPLTERITTRDVPELIELVLGRVLANPELRAQFVAAAEAAEFEALLDA